MKELEGTVNNIIYRSDETGYTVFELAVSGTDKPVTCVGGFSYIAEGECLRIKGRDKHHPVYGDQIEVVSYEDIEPNDAASMERYLASGIIKGVGLKLANRIVKAFGDDTFRVIEEEPEALVDIKGISAKLARAISESFEEKRGIRDLMIFLQKYGISNSLALKIHKEYGSGAKKKILENPYCLAQDIQGVGFKTADALAMNIGISKDCDHRIRAGLLYELTMAEGAGHTYLPADMLVAGVCGLLDVDETAAQRALDVLTVEGQVIVKSPGIGEDYESEPVKVYRAPFYYMELGVARMLLDLDSMDQYGGEIAEAEFRKMNMGEDVELDDLQKKAVREAYKHGVFVLTGGPGTGKTTTIRAMISYFEKKGLTILIAAPTGRAAKRITETTGYEALTIHRLLGCQGVPDDPASGRRGRFTFEKNEDEPLEADAVIIDEMSMVDLPLMHALLKAVCQGTRLILVGDANQLPSVGPGNVLKDILASHRFNAVCLTRIFRQAMESDIIVGAHMINRGEVPKLDNNSKDFFMMERTSAPDIRGVIANLVGGRLARYVEGDVFDVQVLTPMKKGELGTISLNSLLQQFLNPPEEGRKQMEYRDTVFREGDKVMQTKNDYHLEWEIRERGFVKSTGSGIYNGDMGRIRQINTFSQHMVIEFDDNRFVDYPFSQLDELELAYAVTIHKSQGSEYPAIVLPLLTGPMQLFNRNILYTAVTRAKKCVVIVGSRQTVSAMIHNENEQKRYSGLTKCIVEMSMH
ncbi:MAG: ATP-dependent RecD-like DNA helicase [Lachnospiraceae bacterium]|nr:ATP-dependent RecD-like DNA helicase [Lachnospiraceae bacterium]